MRSHVTGASDHLQDIVKYMTEYTLPADDHEAEEVARRAKLYVLIDGDLYRRRDNGVKLRCIPREQGQSLSQDIHGGTCSSHVASRSLVGKVFRQGFLLADSTSRRRTDSQDM